MPKYRYVPQLELNGRLRFLVLSITEAAGVLNVHPQTVYAMLKRGDLRFVRAGRRVLIPRSAIEEFLGESFPQEHERALVTPRESARDLRGRFARPDRR